MSPADVNVSDPAPLVSPEYASLFLSPRVKVKFNSTAPFQPWLSFGEATPTLVLHRPRVAT